MQHLGRDDDRLGHGAGHLQDVFLQHDQAFERGLHGQIAAVHQQAVGRGGNLFQMVQPILALDLGDDARSPLARDGPDALHVLCTGHEGDADEVHTLDLGELDYLAIPVSEQTRLGRRRQTDAFVAPQRAGALGPTDNLLAANLQDREADGAVLGAQHITHRQILIQGSAADRNLLRVRGIFGGREDHPVPGLEAPLVLELPGPHLAARQIK